MKEQKNQRLVYYSVYRRARSEISASLYPYYLYPFLFFLPVVGFACGGALLLPVGFCGCEAQEVGGVRQQDDRTFQSCGEGQQKGAVCCDWFFHV